VNLRTLPFHFLLIGATAAQQPSGTPARQGAPAAQVTMPGADVPDNTVVAVLNGRKFTAEQVRGLVAGTPPQARALYARDPKQFLRDHAYYLMLVDYAEKNGFDKMSPYADALAFYKLFVLSNAALNERVKQIGVKPEEQRAFYEGHQEQFREAHVRMVYIPFTGDGAESAAKEKAEGIVKRTRAGEDFVKLAKEFSDNSDSAGADFAVRPNSSQPPEHMKKVVLSATPGTVTDPLRHENGYYVFRIESTGVLSFDQVRNDIYKEIQNTRFSEWQQQLRSQVSVKFENEAFFQSASPR